MCVRVCVCVCVCDIVINEQCVPVHGLLDSYSYFECQIMSSVLRKKEKGGLVIRGMSLYILRKKEKGGLVIRGMSLYIIWRKYGKIENKIIIVVHEYECSQLKEKWYR